MKACIHLCIDNLIKPFYKAHFWTIVGEDYNNMIDALANSAQHLILLESDPSMSTWL